MDLCLPNVVLFPFLVANRVAPRLWPAVAVVVAVAEAMALGRRRRIPVPSCETHAFFKQHRDFQ